MQPQVHHQVPHEVQPQVHNETTSSSPPLPCKFTNQKCHSYCPTPIEVFAHSHRCPTTPIEVLAHSAHHLKLPTNSAQRRRQTCGK
jgi:hypothetical protein